MGDCCSKGIGRGWISLAVHLRNDWEYVQISGQLLDENLITRLDYASSYTKGATGGCHWALQLTVVQGATENGRPELSSTNTRYFNKKHRRETLKSASVVLDWTNWRWSEWIVACIYVVADDI